MQAMAPDARLFWRLYKPVSEFLDNVKKSKTVCPEKRNEERRGAKEVECRNICENGNVMVNLFRIPKQAHAQGK